MQSPEERNPLLEIRFQIPFDRIKAEHVEPAIDELLKDARERLEKIAGNASTRTWESTMAALDHLTERLDFGMNVTRHLESAAFQDLFEAEQNVRVVFDNHYLIFHRQLSLFAIL